MDIVRGDGSLLKEIDFFPVNEHQAVLQNVATIIATIEKSCPMLRGLGLPSSLRGRPQNVVESIMTGYLYDQIEQFEPRAIISDIQFEHDATSGRTIPIIFIEEVETEDER